MAGLARSTAAASASRNQHRLASKKLEEWGGSYSTKAWNEARRAIPPTHKLERRFLVHAQAVGRTLFACAASLARPGRSLNSSSAQSQACRPLRAGQSLLPQPSSEGFNVVRSTVH
jgi:hypothetical protein